jgi:iron complex outermembrane receptor protein
MLNKLFLPFLFLLAPLVIMAQEASVEAEISTEDGFLTSYTVKISPSAGEISKRETSFNITNLSAGTYVLEVEALSYEVFSKEIQLKHNEQLKLKVKLQLISNELEEVMILDEQSGISSKTPYSFTPVAVEAIQFKSSPNGLMGNLREVPGVYGAEFGQGIVKPFIRGLGFSRVVTVYQGNKLENQQWGADHGLGVNDLGVSRVDVIKGPASVLYGSGALGGVLLVKDNEDYLKSKLLTGSVGSSFNSVSNGYRTFGSIGKRFENDFFFAVDLAYENHADYKDGDGRIVGNSRFNTTALRLHSGIEKS